MPVKKLNLQDLVEETAKKVREIDASDRAQGDKTKAHQRLAKSVLNKLYYDKRRWKNEDSRISLNTLKSYLSRVRTALSSNKWRHHGLEQAISRLAEHYPDYAKQILAMKDMELTETRLAWKALADQARHESGLSVELQGIKFDSPKLGKLLQAKAKVYPGAKDLILATEQDKGRVAALAAIKARSEQAARLVEDMGKVKIDHELLVHLKMPAEDAKAWKEKTANRLSQRKRDTVILDYPVYLEKMATAMAEPIEAFSMRQLTYGIAAATGRRPIEVLILGHFEKVNDHQLKFFGQAKKRRHNKDDGNIIYTLVDSQLVLDALTRLREMDSVKSLSQLTKDSIDDLRGMEIQVNGRVAAGLNEFVKNSVFLDESRIFRDLRGIYARICLEKFFKRDPRWRRKDEDVFFQELLGHEDEESQKAYKPFKLINFDPDLQYTPKKIDIQDILTSFDDKVEALGRATTGIDLHNQVKELFAEDPEFRMSQKALTRETGRNRELIKRYLELVGPALGLQVGTENGGFVLTPAQQVMAKKVLVSDSDLDDEEIKQLESQAAADDNSDDEESAVADNAEDIQDQKSAVDYSHYRAWIVTYESRGKLAAEGVSTMADSQVMATSKADGIMASIHGNAWRRAFKPGTAARSSERPRFSIHQSQGGGWRAEGSLGGFIWAGELPGSFDRQDAARAAWAAFCDAT